MSVDSEIGLLKDTVWRLTGRVLVLENFISKTFGDVLDSSWTSTPKFNNLSGLERVSSVSSSNTSKRKFIFRRSQQQSAKSSLRSANFAKRRKLSDGVNRSISNASNLSAGSDERIRRSAATKVSYEENSSEDEEDEQSQQLITTNVRNGPDEFVPNKSIKVEEVAVDSDENRERNGLEDWNPHSADEEEDGEDGNVPVGRKTAENNEKFPNIKKPCEPLPPLEELPFILRGSYFKVITLDGLKVTAECQKCSNPGKGTIRGCTNSTSNFLTHIKRIHPEILETYQSQRPIGKKGRMVKLAGPKSMQDKRLSVSEQPSNAQLSVLDNSVININPAPATTPISLIDKQNVATLPVETIPYNVI